MPSSCSNRRMGRAGGYHIGRKVDIAGGAVNAIAPGLSVVRERLENRTLFLLAGALDKRDPLLLEAKKPCCLEEEIPSYVYREVRPGQPVRELPAPDSDDHGADALRYGCCFLDKTDWRPELEAERLGPATFGGIMGHEEMWERIESGQAEIDHAVRLGWIDPPRRRRW